MSHQIHGISSQTNKDNFHEEKIKASPNKY